MAVIHEAQLVPSKLELLAGWVPSQPWGGDDLATIGAYRFDDPDGQVGLETHLVRTGDGRVLQVPVTYRELALAGADDHLIGTAEHSVLGTRYVYDAATDPVYVRALAATLLSGTPQAELEYDLGDRSEIRDPSVRVHTVGSTTLEAPQIVTAVATSNPIATVIQAGELRLTLLRVLGGGRTLDTPGTTLVGSWDGVEAPVELVRLG